MKALHGSGHPSFKQGVGKVVSHRTRSWRFSQADLVERIGLKKEETAIVSSRHLLLLNLRGASERGQYYLDGRKTDFVSRKVGDILFVPAGCEWRGWEEGASNAAYLSISIEPCLVEKLCTALSGGPLNAFSPDLGFEDPVIMGAARGIASEIDERNPVSTMLTESYIATIFAQLLRKQRYVAPGKKGGLTSRDLTRVVELMDDDLSADLTLAQLAGHIGFSVPHFCRAFRQSVGHPPHTFIVRRRIAQAQSQLRETDLPITDIALACGFSSSSHFSNTFKRIVGKTPLDYRKGWVERGWRSG